MTKLRKPDDALLMALACGLSAKQASVTVKTPYRRLGDADYAAHLEGLRRDPLARAAAMQTATAVESVRTLADLPKTENARRPA